MARDAPSPLSNYEPLEARLRDREAKLEARVQALALAEVAIEADLARLEEAEAP